MNECPVEVYQNPVEFERLLAAVTFLNPRSVVEVGSMFGGTLWHWMRIANPGAQFVAVDVLVPESDGRHVRQKTGHDVLWHEWAKRRGHRLSIIDEDSTAPSTIQAVKDALSGPVDLLFIDGDHRYKAVRADFDNYSPLVRKGGLIVFHDIAGIADVKQVWEEVQAGRKDHAEFRALIDDGTLGIGVMIC